MSDAETLGLEQRMSNDTSSILILLARWFDQGDELALRCAYRRLADRLVATPEAVRVLGQAAADEIRQDVLACMLHRTDGDLRGVQAPIAYAWTTWRRALISAMRKWGPREAREEKVRQHASVLLDRYDHTAMGDLIDAKRAIDVAASLSGSGRLAVLLTSRPDRIADEDWTVLVNSLPPPPPAKPREALDREEASRLLYPPQEDEDAKQHNQRLNSFDKAFKRAVAQIRKILEVEP